METLIEWEMEDVVRSCLPELDEIEAEFVQECWLREPKVPLKKFSEKWHISAKEMADLKGRVLVRLRELLAKQGIESMADLV